MCSVEYHGVPFQCTHIVPGPMCKAAPCGTQCTSQMVCYDNMCYGVQDWTARGGSLSDALSMNTRGRGSSPPCSCASINCFNAQLGHSFPARICQRSHRKTAGKKKSYRKIAANLVEKMEGHGAGHGVIQGGGESYGKLTSVSLQS